MLGASASPPAVAWAHAPTPARTASLDRIQAPISELSPKAPRTWLPLTALAARTDPFSARSQAGAPPTARAKALRSFLPAALVPRQRVRVRAPSGEGVAFAWETPRAAARRGSGGGSLSRQSSPPVARTTLQTPPPRAPHSGRVGAFGEGGVEEDAWLPDV